MKKLFILVAVFLSMNTILAQENNANNYKIKHNDGITKFLSNNGIIILPQNENFKAYPKVISTYNQETHFLYGADSVSKKNIENSSYWISFGLGKNYFGPAINFGISYSFNNNVFTVKYLKANEFTFSAGGYDSDEPLLKLEEVGALYGRTYREGNILLSLSGGISYIYGINRGKQMQPKEFEKIKISTIGIPFETSFRIEFNYFLGIGASCFGNLNNKKTYLGGMLNIYLGKL